MQASNLAGGTAIQHLRDGSGDWVNASSVADGQWHGRRVDLSPWAGKQISGNLGMSVEANTSAGVPWDSQIADVAVVGTDGSVHTMNKNSAQLELSPYHPFFHALATMHTPQYRTENAGALLGDWPRIPLPATAELLTASATLDRRLAALLDPESELRLQAEWSFLGRLSIPPELPEGTPDRDAKNAARFALTAGWGGAGQGSTVMPRRGDARERDWTATERDRL